MKKPYYIVRAICFNSRCKTSAFDVQRKKVHALRTSGEVHQIENLVCPGCRMWARVTSVKEVTK